MIRSATVHGLVFAGACLVFAIVALPGVEGPLVLDSVKLHALDELVEEHGQLAVLHTPGFEGRFNRIVSMASFALDAQLNDGVSPRSLKATNVVLHIVTAVLVFFLARLLVRITPYPESASAIALATGILWLLSPANTNVVLYAVQRMAMLSGLFTFAGLLCYTSARLQEPGRRRRLYLAVSAFVLLPLAVLSKENGILLLPLAWLVEVYFLHPHRPLFTKRQLVVTAGCGVIAAILAAAFLLPTVASYAERDFSLVERLLSQPRAIVSYAWQLLVPLGADTGIHTDGFTVSRGFFTPLSTVFALVAVLAMLVFCAIFRDRRAGLLSFGLAFFLVGHALESSVIPLELYFMHRNYLPGFGIYFAAAAAIVLLLPKRPLAYAALAAYGLLFAIAAWTRSETWSSRETIAMTAVREHPDSARAWSTFAQLATDSRQFDLAEHAANEAARLSGAPAAKVQRLYVLCVSGTAVTADDLRSLVNNRRYGTSVELSQALANLLGLYEQGGCPQLPVPLLAERLDTLSARYAAQGRDPWVIDFYSTTLLYAAGETDRAHRRLQRRFDEGHIESGLYRLELLVGEDRNEQASALLEALRRKLAGADSRAFDDTLDEIATKLAP